MEIHTLQLVYRPSKLPCYVQKQSKYSSSLSNSNSKDENDLFELWYIYLFLFENWRHTDD